MANASTFSEDRLRAHMKDDHEVTVSRARRRDQILSVHQLLHAGETADHEHEDV